MPDGTTVVVTHGGAAIPAGRSPSIGRRPTMAACGWAAESVCGKNMTGAKAWRYTQRNDWCWSGNSKGFPVVVSHSGPEISQRVYSWSGADGWSAGGKQDDKSWDYFGDHWVYRNYSEGSMDFCPPRIWCFQHKYPYVYLDDFGNGTYNAYWGA